MPEQSNDYRIVVLGAGGVGKTSLILRFIKGTFDESYVPTVEDTYQKMVNSENNVCTLQITDSAGSHQFPAMQRLSIARGHAFILVYSITSCQSLDELRPIFEQILTLKGDLKKIPVCLVGNKQDENDRVVSVEQGKELASRWGCEFLETSAKTNRNVSEVFKVLLANEQTQTLTLVDDFWAPNSSRANRRRNIVKMKCVIY